MTIYYNAQDRKPLVKAISEFTGADAVYMRTPTYAYRIDYFTVTREGNLEFDDRADSEEIEGLLEFLAERGFIAENAATEPLETNTEKVPAAADSAEHGKTVGLTVEVPLESTAVGNLTKLLDAKGRLIRRALAVDSLSIEVTGSTVKFPWFADCGTDECKASSRHSANLPQMQSGLRLRKRKPTTTSTHSAAFSCGWGSSVRSTKQSGKYC